MAGNFWQSSHYQQWILDKQDLLHERSLDLQNSKLSEDEYQKILIFFSNIIQALGENLKVRQQVIATATVYFRRFYARNSLKCIDPILLAPTTILLASKVEEFGLISQSKLLTACHNIIKNNNHIFQLSEYPYRMNHVMEAEFLLLEMMDCCLIVYHAYRPLMQFLQDLSNDEALVSLSWKIANDSLRTDICLLYAPYQIALACLTMASVVLNKDLKNWFAELSVDMEKIMEIVQYILALYEMWRNFDEKKEMPAILQKMPKPNVEPSRPPSASGATSKQHQDVMSSNSMCPKTDTM